jgi:hypothetical protein
MSTINWDALPLGLTLGATSDEEIAVSLKTAGFTCDRSTVTRQRRKRHIPRYVAPALGDDIDWSIQPLGAINDRILGLRLGLPDHVVRDAREAREIPPCRRHLCIDWSAQPLGEILDICIAARLGCTHVTVLNERTARGIPTAPQSDRNLLLSLVYKNPGQRTSWYADHLSRPEPSVRRDLKDFERLGFVARQDRLLWSPIRTPARDHELAA